MNLIGLLCPHKHKIVSSLSLHRAGDMSRKQEPAAAALVADADDYPSQSSTEDDDDDVSYLLEGDSQTTNVA